ncbi:type I polyketide synthase [Streptomyces nanshensis]|uniref:type I polyketide synthase n=1 Tax=Streptomyces nanshensis TaxID=518642 RepID=UPI00085C7FDB|nr:type I polyketide synthase [Streptomyces nanshensis]
MTGAAGSDGRDGAYAAYATFAGDERAVQPPVAVVGMAGRFPGAGDVDALWSMLTAGREAVRRFSDDELRAAGVPEELAADPEYVPYGADLAGIEDFDAAFFGMTPAEARLVDPQQRIFLECVWRALEDAGTPPTAYDGAVGVFAGSSLSSYLLHHVLRSPEYRDQAFTYPVLLGNDKDFFATRVSYALNLRGPSLNVQSACSSSLVAVDQACAALRSGGCDVAVAGGASVFTPQTAGYRYRSGGTYARDGHCRPFDAAASGMVSGSGCGVVVLKRLDDALADRDRVYAVVAGTAVNNDGSLKAGYSAPSALGQEEAVRRCLELARIPASAVGYVEAHGTGTYLGDPIEVSALTRAYERGGDPPAECALGSIKANIGHLDAAAGVTGLIKTALVLYHQTVPPQVNFTEPNPELRLAETPFVVRDRLLRPAAPISAAAVSSLGIGGTNAHSVLTRAPAPPPRGAEPGGDVVLTLSAPDERGVRDTAADLLTHLDRNPETRLDDLAYTLAHGRLRMKHRISLTAATQEEAVARLREVCDGRHEERRAADGGSGGAADGRTSRTEGPDGGTAQARKIRLPGIRLHRARHWIEFTPASGPAAPPTPPGGEAPEERAEPAAGERAEDPVAVATEVFRARLGIESVGPDDDYFALGGDSLHAIEVADALSRRLEARLTLEQFTRLGTPRAVAEWCAAPHDDASLVPVKEGKADEVPVFLIHPSGGTVSFALGLAGHSADPSPVYGIKYPVELADSLTTVPRIAEHHVRLIQRVRPHGPYRLGGYSFGGTVALEAARLLTGMGERVEQVLLWDTPPPHEKPGRERGEQEFLDLFPGLLRLTFALPAPEGAAGPGPGPAADEGEQRPRTVDEAVESVRAPDWSQATVRELTTMYTVWRTCDRALASYRPRPYDGPVHLFSAEQPLPAGTLAGVEDADAPRSPDELRQRWRRQLTGELRVTPVPGHHFDMFDSSRLPGLAAAYDEALAGKPGDTATSGAGTRAAPGGAGSRATAEAVPAAAAGGPRPRPVALVFPGQGTQYPGMGRELFARHPELTAEADEVLGYSVADVCAGDPLRPLTDTTWTQPAVYVVNALALRGHVEETGEHPAVTLGHSIGEYNALEAAGVFTFAQGLRLVAGRARAMARIAGGMIAVNGLTEEEIGEILDARNVPPEGGPEADGASGWVDLAAANAPRAHTLAGPEADLDALTPVLLSHGARSVRRLDVSGPFHSRLMRPAAREFGDMLDDPALTGSWAPPAVPVIANTTARAHVPGGIRDELVAQIDHTVLWRRSVERAVADHEPEFREIGARRVLMPMISQIRASLTGG